MGIVTLGIPREITLELARLNNATAFVETGTYRGDTTRWASQHFASVFTIERSEALYKLHHQDLAKLPGVKPLRGDSRMVLPSVLSEIGDRKALFWLDGHWSGGETAGAGDECPLLDELACLSGRTADIILIDDARLFLSAPPRPHKPSAWPTIIEVGEALPVSHGRLFIQIVDDVIFAVPNQDPLKSFLIDYAQRRAEAAERTRVGRRQLKSVLGALVRRVTAG
jgi:hypothetical protein